MPKSVKISILIFSILLITGLTILLVKNQPTQILFYSDTCPHCKIVEKYISDNSVDKYIVFRKLEVSTSQANAQLLTRKAISCGLSTEGLGVPFFFDGKNCLVGDQDIINYFSSKK